MLRLQIFLPHLHIHRTGFRSDFSEVFSDKANDNMTSLFLLLCLCFQGSKLIFDFLVFLTFDELPSENTFASASQRSMRA